MFMTVLSEANSRPMPPAASEAALPDQCSARPGLRPMRCIIAPAAAAHIPPDWATRGAKRALPARDRSRNSLAAATRRYGNGLPKRANRAFRDNRVAAPARVRATRAPSPACPNARGRACRSFALKPDGPSPIGSYRGAPQSATLSATLSCSTMAGRKGPRQAESFPPLMPERRRERLRRRRRRERQARGGRA